MIQYVFQQPFPANHRGGAGRIGGNRQYACLGNYPRALVAIQFHTAELASGNPFDP